LAGNGSNGIDRNVYDSANRRDVIVVGGGQAGLAMGYFLARERRDFTILEAAEEPAAAWRSRWDSLKLFTPARYSALPGLPFPGDPDRYPTRDDVAGYLADYARHFDLPIELDSRVRSIRKTDGGYLYAGSKTKAFVHRLLLPAMTPDLSIPLGSYNGSEPYVVSDFAMLDGEPQSFVAALSHNNSSGGIVVFDNATARATSIAPVQALELPRWLVRTPVPGTFLSQSYGPSAPQVNTLDQVTVSASGINTSSSATMAAGLILGGKPERTGNRLYSPDGKALNATTGALLAVLGLPEQGVMNGLLVDNANNRMFIWAVVRARPFILSYDLTTLKLLAFAPLPLPVGSSAPSTPGTGNMTLWGTDGLAVADGTQVIILSGAFFSSYRGEPTIPRL